ncbi:subtilisin-like serine protease family protein [Rhizoctonia solani 123E]|uniref:Subtilisin-like serine protease family protein n=2 Tax=Rhizoctonia solani TaxID=456999 RepID=A0A074RJT0_9AGAM|nr:subtilisin-like serine protease family protein [Rhizoctonia solani 123E]
MSHHDRANVIKASENPIPGSYFVRLKPATNLDNHLAAMKAQLQYKNTPHTYKVKYTYDPELISGYSVSMNDSALEELRKHHEVESVYEDCKVEADKWENEDDTKTSDRPVVVTRTNVPWGLDRISRETALPPGSDSTLMNYEYHHFEPTISAVDVYVIDTGIMIDHTEFDGRAIWGTNFADDKDTDLHGHGTHVAGIIGGSRVGVSGTARIIAVKILGLEPWAEATRVMKAIEWVFHQARQSGNPSVINASLRAEPFEPLDIIANIVVDGGMHFCASAGNQNKDADSQSPGRARNVVTVGATSIDDERWYLSNFGEKVDIFAPGADIISAGIKSKDYLFMLSGTSMASPHVAGLIAYFLSLGAQVTPSEMKRVLKELGIKDVLKHIPKGTANCMLWNGVSQDEHAMQVLQVLQDQRFPKA